MKLPWTPTQNEAVGQEMPAVSLLPAKSGIGVTFHVTVLAAAGETPRNRVTPSRMARPKVTTAVRRINANIKVGSRKTKQAGASLIRLATIRARA